MRNNSVLRGVTLWTASLGLLFPPQFLMAAGEDVLPPQGSVASTAAVPVAGKAVHVRDVELGPNGMLAGQIVNAQGQPVARTTVTLKNQTVRLRTISDPRGQFQFSGLTGGNYHLESDQGGAALSTLEERYRASQGQSENITGSTERPGRPGTKLRQPGLWQSGSRRSGSSEAFVDASACHRRSGRRGDRHPGCHPQCGRRR